MKPTRRRTTKKANGERRSPSASRRGVPAGRFKATCLALMEKVRRTGVPITVTKHGAPLVRVVPVVDPAAPPLFGRLKGTMRITGDITAPIDAEWDVLADD